MTHPLGYRLYYVAGPITGLPELNKPAFDAETASLRKQGYGALNPHDIPPPKEGTPSDEETWCYYMRKCIALVSECSHMRMLPGWQNSRGACLEHKIATALGMPIEYVKEQA